MEKENKYPDLPYTLFEIQRESLSTIPEKTEEELYGVKEEEIRVPSKILSGKWVGTEDESLLWWYPNGEKMMLQDYTDMETGEFYLEYDEDLTSCYRLFLGEEDDNEYGAYVLNISSLPDTSKVTTMEGMFMNCDFLESLDLSGLDTSKATNMKDMFNWTASLKSLDLSGLDTSNVTTMEGMFGYDTLLESINLSGFNTSKVTNMSEMFTECSSLKSLDLSSFNTSNVTNIYSMFMDCSSLESLDLSSFNTSKVTDIDNIFYGCDKLKSLNLSNFDTSQVIVMRGICLL